MHVYTYTPHHTTPHRNAPHRSALHRNAPYHIIITDTPPLVNKTLRLSFFISRALHTS